MKSAKPTPMQILGTPTMRNVQKVVRGSLIRGGPNPPPPPPKMIRGSRITYPKIPPPPLPSKMIRNFPDHPSSKKEMIHQFVSKKCDPKM